MIEQKLTDIENQKETQQIIELLRKERDTFEESIDMPKYRPYPKQRRNIFLISPYWLVAASFAGFILGLFTPDRIYSREVNHSIATVDTISRNGCSIAQMDIDTTLLITL